VNNPTAVEFAPKAFGKKLDIAVADSGNNRVRVVQVTDATSVEGDVTRIVTIAGSSNAGIKFFGFVCFIYVA